MTENEKDQNRENIEEKEIAGETFEEEEVEVRKRPFPRVLLIIVILAVAAALYYFLIHRRGAKTERLVDIPSAAVLEKELPPAPLEGPDKPPVNLDESDDLVRSLAKEISTHPRLADWLNSKGLIRRFVAAVDNIANGLSPRAHVDFFEPPGEFGTAERGGLTVADPDGYGRYHTVVDVFVSLESNQCVSLFRSMKPLCQEAYRDLGYPDQDFEQTILRAIVELMGTPVVEGSIYLEKAVLNYVILDPALENLSDAQKHLLRMGLENVGAIQAKLREMALALGFAEDRLPKTRYYTPRIPDR
ncbi:MAG: DUF3014 domain-containing protein [Candidatus Aminicenantales bacterium]